MEHRTTRVWGSSLPFRFLFQALWQSGERLRQSGERARRAGRRRRAAWCIQTPKTPRIKNQPGLQRWTAPRKMLPWKYLFLKSARGFADKRQHGDLKRCPYSQSGSRWGKRKFLFLLLFLGAGNCGWEESFTNNLMGLGMDIDTFEMVLRVPTDFGQQVHYRSQAAWLLKHMGLHKAELNFGVKHYVQGGNMWNGSGRLYFSSSSVTWEKKRATGGREFGIKGGCALRELERENPVGVCACGLSPLIRIKLKTSVSPFRIQTCGVCGFSWHGQALSLRQDQDVQTERCSPQVRTSEDGSAATQRLRHKIRCNAKTERKSERKTHHSPSPVFGITRLAVMADTLTLNYMEMSKQIPHESI